MIYFLSDTHFSHDRAFIYEPRGFKSLADMEAAIITNWNSVVSDEDEVYLLGDFVLGSDINRIDEIVSQLNGKIHLIIGNHDSAAKIAKYKTIDKIVEVSYATMLKFNKRLYYLSHFPTLTATLQSDPKKSIFGLSGHTHSKELFYEGRPYMYNVAVDAHGCKPVSMEEIERDIDAEIAACERFCQ